MKGVNTGLKYLETKLDHSVPSKPYGLSREKRQSINYGISICGSGFNTTSIMRMDCLGPPLIVLVLAGLAMMIPSPPNNNPPQPGEPGGGGIPTGNSLIMAEALLDSLGLLGEVVAVFPPYADGSLVSPRTGFRTFAAIHTDDLNPR